MLVLETRSSHRMDRLAFSPGGREVTAGDWTGVCSWSLDTLELLADNRLDGVNGLGKLSDGRLVVGTTDGLHVRAAGTNVFPQVHSVGACFTTVSPASSVVVRGGTCYRVTADSALEELWTDPQEVRYPPAISPDGKWLATPFHGDRTHGVRVAKLATGRIVRRAALSAGLPQLVVSSDMSCFASLFLNKIRTWRPVGRSRTVTSFADEAPDDVSALAFHPSGRYLVATCHDHQVKFYDAETGHLAKAYAWDIGRMRSLAFSPDGLVAAAGSDTGKVVVWDVDG